tara:strand:- start:11 stop:547 length:537 start_codon:yes stop_codon:yes gene_type:complete
MEGAGFGLGAALGAGAEELLALEDDDELEDGALGVVSVGASCLSFPSVGLVLENIASYPYVCHGIYRLVIEPNFIMQMGAGGTPGIAHAANALSAGDTLSNGHIDGVQMRIKGFIPELVTYFNQIAKPVLDSGKTYHPIGRGDHRCLGRAGHVEATMHSARAHSKARRQTITAANRLA